MASHPWRLMEKIDWAVLAVDLAEELSAFPFVGDITSLSSQEKWQHLSKMLKKTSMLTSAKQEPIVAVSIMTTMCKAL